MMPQPPFGPAALRSFEVLSPGIPLYNGSSAWGDCSMQKITPFLWFDDNAEEAVQFYTSIFKNSKTTGVTHYPEDGPGVAGTVMTITFELDGQEFIALNGGPVYQFSPAISLLVHCETQEEIDELREKLAAGGETMECGWLKDKYGISWQIDPAFVGEMLKAKDTEKSHRAFKALWQMQKLDIKRLKAAYTGSE
jgi:predicted 3-demethylubiquinone-9 3-methyltransferase (glyoxalase superfamily)